MMRLTSHVMVLFWSCVCVRSQDPPSGNSSSAEDFHTNPTPPCFIHMGDAPCGAVKSSDVTEIDIFTSSTVTETVLTALLTTSVGITTATESTPTPPPPKPATVTPTNSPEVSKFTTKAPVIVGEIVYKTQEDERNTSESTNCSFDPCLHLQNTCFNTPDPTCRCPGVSSGALPPDSPPSLKVTAVTHRVALVEWCAPHSPVLEYSLLVRHRGLAVKNLTFSPAVRQVFVSDMTDYVYHICVQAVNRAGPSGPRCVPLWMTLNTDVYLYSLVTACSVLAVIVGTLSVCLYKQCKKQPVENLHLTRLISIPNPTFFNP